MSESNIASLSNSEINGKVTQVITNLKILAKIKTNNKLTYKGDQFIIDEWNYTQPVRRWWTKESRTNTLQKLEEFVESLFNIIGQIYNNEIKNDDVVKDVENSYYAPKANITFQSENSSILLSFVTEMQGAIIGLNTLKHTYKHDITTVSSLEMIIEKINVRVKKITNIMKIHKSK
tara:strand:+ start:16766 stop:17293 length:528 start_codon:yes stop_codon:yes gene_type:complete